MGYTHVSSFDQNPTLQLEHVLADKVFADQASGKATQRPQLDALLEFAPEGDTMEVPHGSTGANSDDLRRVAQPLTQRGVRIAFLKEHWIFTDEDSTIANPMLFVMGAFA